jgi:hypothetical protein
MISIRVSDAKRNPFKTGGLISDGFKFPRSFREHDVGMGAGAIEGDQSSHAADAR